MTEKAKKIIKNELRKKTGTLNLSKCELDYIPIEIAKMDWLNKLDLSGNQISKMQGLEGLYSLTTIDLHDNQINRLEGLEGLSNLTKLELYRNQISKMEALEGLYSLTSLSLSGNQINKLEGLESLYSLKELYLHNNQISKMEALDGLSSLSILYLASNQINKMEGLEGLFGLKSISLHSNKISKLEGLEDLTNLTTLSLHSNQINKLEGLEGLYSLTELGLSKNQISKLEGIEDLSSLSVLSIYSNQISKLEGLEGLSNLVALFIANNQISKVEGLLTSLNLKIMDLANNPLSELPIEYKDFLNSLQHLNLKGTKIENLSFFYQSIKKGEKILSEDIRHLKGEAIDKKNYFQYSINNQTYHTKRGINVKDCKQLDDGLIAAIQNGQKSLLEYIEEPRERLFEARVLVLGEPRAGKTTLRKKLQDVHSAMPTEQESTKAFEIEVEPYECAIDLNGQKEKLRYHLWDFGGQDYYRLLHQLFVTEQSVYIIVVDTDRNKNEEEIAFWMDTIERLGKDERQQYGPVILFQNPKNQRPGGSFTDLKKQYPFWQQTDDFVINLNALNEYEAASFNKNELLKFSDFKKYLSRSFCRLTHVGKEIPVKWIAIRKALLKEKENWIPVERFNQLCKENEEKDEKQRSNLLNIFRQLGYLLHYKNTALNGMVILNREWVTDALYRVLDDPIVDENKGWFAKEDTQKIWKEEKYRNRTEELLALMQEFKLCYQNPSTKKYIVPSKLPGSIDNFPVWDATDNVRLRLQYDWMPKAVAIQLLVSLHEYIHTLADGEQWIWRKGAVLDGKQLDLANVRVRIRDEYDNKRIAIDATGTHSEVLFRILMKKWKEVNEPFKDKVKVTPIILCPCATCAALDMPHTFRYQTVLKAKQQNKHLQCNESFIAFKAEDILKGVYDETTVLIDSLEEDKKEGSSVLDLISADKLDKAIEKISSPEYKTLFDRRLKDWNRNNLNGTLSFEKKTQTRNILAQDLVKYFTLDRGQELHQLERLKEDFAADQESFPGKRISE